MLTIFVVGILAIAGVAAASIGLLYAHLKRIQVSNRELWQLSIRAGIERYQHTQRLHAQVDALAGRCLEHGDSGQKIAEILRAASAVRSS